MASFLVRSSGFFVLALLYMYICATPPATAEIAAELHVPQDFPTLQAAINAAASGDTVLVGPGVYAENVRFNGLNLTVRSTDGPQATIIQAPGGTAVSIGPGGSLIGFTIKGGTATFGAGMETIGIGSLIKGNVFDGNSEGSGGFGAAIAGNTSSPIIEQNIFRNNSCDNQFLSAVISFVNLSSPRIVNNIFEDNPCRAIDMTLPIGTMPEVINNTMVRNRAGVRVDRRVPTQLQVFRNNIIVGNGLGLEINFGTEADNPTWENNLVFGNTTNYSGILDQTGQSGNISADPLFVNFIGGNYRLQPGSAAIDAGSVVGAPGTDFEGNPRPVDGTGDGIAAVDIGAYEFAAVIVNLFDLCLQDDSNGNIIQLNTATGEYLFTNCGGFTLGGVGRLIRKGSLLSLQHYGSDRRVILSYDGAARKATASIQVFSPGRTFSIIDRNTSNNDCRCAAP